MSAMIQPLVVGLFLIFSFCSQARAAFDVPKFRGSDNSTYQQWDWFTSATGANLPDVANNNPNGSASLIEITGAGVVTSGGNIYLFATPAYFEVSVPDFDLGTQASTRVVVQIRTQGTALDIENVAFNSVSPDSIELLYDEPLGGFGGALQEWKFEWNSVPGNVDVNLISFNAVEGSMSLDRLAIDTQAIPTTPSSPELVAAHVLQVGFSGAGNDPWKEVDLTTELIHRSSELQTAQLANFINNSRGLNGLVLDFSNLDDLEQLSFEYSWSPQGSFSQPTNPVATWQVATSPTSTTLHIGQGNEGSDRIRIEWPNQSIVNRYLRIVVRSHGDVVADLLVGHLLGGQSDADNGVFTVSFSDIATIRGGIGSEADAGNNFDINKDGSVSFADISDARSNVGAQLTQVQF